MDEKAWVNIEEIADKDFIIEGNSSGLNSIKQMIDDSIQNDTLIEFQDYCNSNMLGMECSDTEYQEPIETLKTKIYDKLLGILVFLWFAIFPIIGLFAIFYYLF